jgi:hypothetical protein
MSKRWALYFCMAGYLFAIWGFLLFFAPLTSPPWEGLLQFTCVSCAHVTVLQSSRLKVGLLFVAPVNAAFFAGIGFVFGKVVQEVKGLSK